MQITSWEDRRSAALGFAGLLAPWLAIIGYILSAARTKAMNDANRQQVDDHRQRLYMDALETLNRKRDYQKAGAIESLRKLGSQEDGEYRTQAIEILTAFIRSTARIADENTNQRLNSNGTALNLASAPHALSDLQSQMEMSLSPLDEGYIIFEDLDLSALTFTKGKSILGVNFRACNFSGCLFMNVTFSHTNFWVCNFNKAILNYSHFTPQYGGSGISFSKSTLDGTYIHFTDFEHVGPIEKDQFRKVRYDIHAPPKNVPKTTGGQAAGVLPTPFVRDGADPNTGHYISVERTKQYYAVKDSENRTGPFRPLHKDGTPVPIIHPDFPDDVILD